MFVCFRSPRPEFNLQRLCGDFLQLDMYFTSAWIHLNLQHASVLEVYLFNTPNLYPD